MWAWWLAPAALGGQLCRAAGLTRSTFEALDAPAIVAAQLESKPHLHDEAVQLARFSPTGPAARTFASERVRREHRQLGNEPPIVDLERADDPVGDLARP